MPGAGKGGMLTRLRLSVNLISRLPSASSFGIVVLDLILSAHNLG